MRVPGISTRPRWVPELSTLTFQVGTIIALTVVLVVNALANSLPIGGRTTGDVSSHYPEAFSPAGYAFTIWTAIYAGLVVYAVYQALPEQRNNRRIMAVAPWFWLTCAANTAWLFLWHYERITGSLAAMAVLFASLAAVYYLLHRTRADQAVATAELWCAHVPFSLYFGWVSVAALANLSVWAVHFGLGLAINAPNVWAVLTIAAGTVLASALGWAARDSVYLAAVLWAFIAIVVRHGVPHPVSTTALGGAVIVTAVLARALYLNRGNVLTPSQSSARA